MTALLDRPHVRQSMGPRPHRWTCEEFHNIGDTGMLEGQSVILIDGEILRMPNPNPPHDSIVGIADYKLKEIFQPGYWVRIQSGLPTALDTDPVPDIAVVRGSPRDYFTQYPRTAVLVVEVSDSSFDYDVGVKSNLYAAAGILDYWVIDVNGRQLIVFRDPTPDAAAPRGFRYASTQILNVGDSITPLAATAAIAVADLLP